MAHRASVRTRCLLTEPATPPRRIQVELRTGTSEDALVKPHVLVARRYEKALNQLDDDEKATVINLIESVLLRHQARRLARSS